MPHKRIHVFYSGYVQGVGFRYTVRRIASGLDLQGWVRNLPDGKVEVVCEGEKERLKDFLDKVRGEFSGSHLRDAQISWGEAEGEFDSFEIRF